ncbi:MAG: hypothetical protein C0603_05765 [Denitrovibrio sp.]|nr:MAG: hypothetical protein C0603_05765 [Denitrovibrio sp.]
MTLDKVMQIVKHDRSNFSQDSNAITTINIFMAHNLVKDKQSEDLNSELISDLHKELVKGLPNILDTEGSYRKGGPKADEKWIAAPYSPPGSPLDINFLIKNLIDWLETEAKDLNPIIKASLLHMHIKKIQPYNNANGYTARLMEAWYLRNNNIKLLPYILPVIYNENHEEYYKCISEFYATSNPNPMIDLISAKIESLVTKIRDDNYNLLGDIISSHYLTKLLSEKTLIKRQFDFLSILKDEQITFKQEDLQLKKPFTKFYGKVSRTTVTRDIKKFEDLGLIKNTKDGYIFNHNMLEA